MRLQQLLPLRFSFGRILVMTGLVAPAMLVFPGCNPKTASEPPASEAYVRVPLPPPTPESISARLTNPPSGVVPHVVAAASNFVQPVVSGTPGNPETPENTLTLRRLRPRPAPELIPKSGITITDGQIAEKDWTGITLVPKSLATSLVHTSKVSVQYIEVHPLENGRVRIWARLQNLQGTDDKIEIGCSFRTNENPDSSTPTFFEIDLPKDYIDIFFVSPKENINAYTFLVRDIKSRDERRSSRDDL
jgi:hypothetical protein